jgi:uncharacterized paraquat-inducible protein A
MTFEQYLAQHEANMHPSQRRPDRTRCTGCCKEIELVTSDGECAECMRYHYGYDQAEAQVATAMIRGAVMATLEAEVPTETIVLAMHGAMEDYQGGVAEDMINGLRRVWAEKARA